jgi:hypothetical protein
VVVRDTDWPAAVAIGRPSGWDTFSCNKKKALFYISLYDSMRLYEYCMKIYFYIYFTFPCIRLQNNV